MKNQRPEQDIFAELESLCATPGYGEAIAAFCLRDNFISFTRKGVAGDDLARLYSPQRLIRTEIATLVGLFAKSSIAAEPPTEVDLEGLMIKTEALLEEMHDALSRPFFEETRQALQHDSTFDPFSTASAFREPIFYSGESAYVFQYKDFARKKYENDDPWLLSNLGFVTEDSIKIFEAIEATQFNRLNNALRGVGNSPPQSPMKVFCFDIADVQARTGLPADTVRSVITAFTLHPEDRNATFKSIQDFNATNSTPILHLNDDRFILFQTYSLAEALYETPFFWLAADKTYASTSLKHRGEFTEIVAHDCLCRALGKAHVHSNVVLPGTKGSTLGEIDTLVVFGDVAIIVQAKSKRLTIAARKGNDLQLKADFKNAVQAAHDQAMDCAKILLEPQRKILTAEGKALQIKYPIRQVYPICIVSDHYPALAFQARQFLKHNEISGVAPPLVTDVFALDVFSEMLSSPLRFISFLDLRAKGAEKFFGGNELTLLGYHLRCNLWIDDGVDMVMLDDSIAQDLDAAMLVRRTGMPGKRTPDGILTRFVGTAADRFLSFIATDPNPASLSLGLFLLEVNEKTFLTISHGMERLVAMTRHDGQHHDLSLAIGDGGITLHSNYEGFGQARDHLSAHCAIRKYKQKAGRWYGVGLNVVTGSVRMAIKLEEPWRLDPAFEAVLPEFRDGAKLVGDVRNQPFAKVGRNDFCPCGSGRKYKKCCLH